LGLKVFARIKLPYIIRAKDTVDEEGLVYLVRIAGENKDSPVILMC